MFEQSQQYKLFNYCYTAVSYYKLYNVGLYKISSDVQTYPTIGYPIAYCDCGAIYDRSALKLNACIQLLKCVCISLNNGILVP